MTALFVTYSKLVRYCELNGGYDLQVNGATVSLSFTPVFPEAVEKGDSTPPRVYFLGTIKDEKIQFTMIRVEDENGVRDRTPEEAEVVYRGWLDYIEENF